LFFILSGFILTYTYENNILGSRNRARFWQARFARIYPVYVFSLLLALWFERALSIPTRVAVLSMVQAWNPLSPHMTGAWNFPAWTLSVEAFFYLCFPFILPWFSQRRETALRLSGLTLLAVSVLAHTPLKGLGFWDASPPIPLPIWRMPEFLLGMVLGVHFLRVAKTPANGHPWRVLIASIAALLILGTPLNSWTSLVVIPFVILIHELAHGDNWLARILSSPVMVLLGGASYAIYLLQYPVRCWVRTIFLFFPSNIERWGAPLTPLILILFSILVFRFWEEPARKALRFCFAFLEGRLKARATPEGLPLQ
jgi:peptidoglycan/LPS O-acetylase OafA/YrhL